jgi:DNA polymerase-1
MSLFGGVTLPGKPDLANIARLDRLPLPQIQRMQRYGFAIDKEYMLDLSAQFRVEMRELEKDIVSYIPADRLHEFNQKSEEIEEEEGSASINPSSAIQIATLLFDMLGVGKTVQLKKTKSHQLSTGKKQLELLKNEHPVIKKVLKHRELDKLIGTYTDKFPEIAVHHPRSRKSTDLCPVCELHHTSAQDRIHGEVVSTRARTGRFAHRRPNLGNIPQRTDNGELVRAGFIAPPGYELASVDFGQIELRDLAHCAQAKSMIKVYDEDRDIHVATACAVFEKDEPYYMRLLSTPEKQLAPAEAADLHEFKLKCRLPSKNVNFMVIYGATEIGLQAQLALSSLLWTTEECIEFIERWFNLYPEVQAYIDEQHYRARRYGFVWDQFGRVRLIPECSSTHTWIASAGLRQAGNMPIQSIAAGQMKLAMGEVEKELIQILSTGVWCWPLMTIHDQLITEVEEGFADKLIDIKTEIFQNVMHDKDTGERQFLVPIKADGEQYTRWIKG